MTKRSETKEGLNMYGLLLINMQDYVTKVFGAKQYEEVREALKIKDVSHTISIGPSEKNALNVII